MLLVVKVHSNRSVVHTCVRGETGPARFDTAAINLRAHKVYVSLKDQAIDIRLRHTPSLLTCQHKIDQYRLDDLRLNLSCVEFLLTLATIDSDTIMTIPEKVLASQVHLGKIGAGELRRTL